jgi:hypothetical protein
LVVSVSFRNRGALALADELTVRIGVAYVRGVQAGGVGADVKYVE